MYTRCPDCETTFKLGAADLRRAQGKVRCGDCGNVFNAIEFLAEAPEDTDASLPVLTQEGAVAATEPANEFEAGIQNISEPVNEYPEHTSNAYADSSIDEIANDTWSPLDTSSWDTDIATASASIGLDQEASAQEGIAEKALNEDEACIEEAASNESTAAPRDPTMPMPLISNSEAEGILEASPLANHIEAADAEADANDADDFDDALWERIPGVGALEPQDTEQSDETEASPAEQHLADGLSYAAADYFTAGQESAPTEWDNDTDVLMDDDADLSSPAADALLIATEEAAACSGTPENESEVFQFDAPENKWTSFFGTEPELKPCDPDNDSDNDSKTPAADAQTAADDTNEDFNAAPEDSVSTDTQQPVTEPSVDSTLPDHIWAVAQAEFAAAASEQTEHATENSKAATFDAAADVSTVEDSAPEASAETTESDSIFAEHEDEPDNPADEPSSDHSDHPWANMEPTEEIVLSTGTYDTRELASLTEPEEADEADATKSDQTNDWRPKHWETEVDLKNPGDSIAPATWLAGYMSSKNTGTLRGMSWMIVLVVLTISFATQLLHYNRDRLAANPDYGHLVRAVYTKLGQDLYPDWEMGSYEIRGSEAIAGESGENILDIRTQIASISDLSVGLPQLRVILRDRWSNPVAARNFEPEEYANLDALPANGMLEPNQTIVAHVAIVDPGAGTQGFQLELCVPRRNTGLDCTGQPFN
jgi:predicted Zn finger-like uncharacterized protein